MARVDPALAAARGAVRAELARLAADGGLVPGGLVLVACSGGADSLALAAVTAVEGRRVGRSVRSRGHAVRVGAVVVDHGLQPGSDDVAVRAAEQCRALGLDPVVVRRVHVAAGPGAGGTEAAARDARYGALAETAAELDAVAVLLGHTLDDQAESVLLGLARGSGARSLAGMPRRRGRYRRPFLDLRRTQTEAVCAALGIDFWTDPTNLLPDVRPCPSPSGAGKATDRDDGAPARTRVRHAVVPVLEDVLGPGVVAALGRTADQLRDDADLLDRLAADLLVQATVPAEPAEPCVPAEPTGPTGPTGPAGPGGAAAPAGRSGGRAPDAGGLVLDAVVLAGAPAALRRRALRSAAAAVGCAPGATGARHVDALDALVVSWRGQGAAHLPGGARAVRACGRLFLRPSPDRTHTPPPDAAPQPPTRPTEE